MKSKSIVDKIPQSFKAPDKAKALNFDFGFWDEALLLDTDPPTDPKPTEPTPETKPEAPKEPVETSTSSTPEDVKTTVQTALKEFFEALKPADPKPTEPTPDPKPDPSRTTPESKMPKTFGEVTNEMLADMMKGL